MLAKLRGAAQRAVLRAPTIPDIPLGGHDGGVHARVVRALHRRALTTPIATPTSSSGTTTTPTFTGITTRRIVASTLGGLGYAACVTNASTTTTTTTTAASSAAPTRAASTSPAAVCHIHTHIHPQHARGQEEDDPLADLARRLERFMTTSAAATATSTSASGKERTQELNTVDPNALRILRGDDGQVKAVYYKGVPIHKLSKSSDPSKQRVVLLACGSFSPVTNFHLYMMEMTRDHLTLHHPEIDVIGGIISPVHDTYGKSSLKGVGAERRVRMLELATDPSDWVAVSPWEAMEASRWTPTREVMEHIRDALREASKLVEGEAGSAGSPIQVKLLIGADVFDTMSDPRIWKPSDVETILGDFGVIVTQRAGNNIKATFEKAPALKKYESNVLVSPMVVENNISSSVVRSLLAQGRSVKHLIPDNVAEYIRTQNLYNAASELKYHDRPRMFDVARLSKL